MELRKPFQGLCRATVGGKQIPLMGPIKLINKENKYLILTVSLTVRLLKHKFLASPSVLEGLGSSGRLIGTISTSPGTYKCPGSRVMAKNPPGGIFFTEYGM